MGNLKDKCIDTDVLRNIQIFSCRKYLPYGTESPVSIPIPRKGERLQAIDNWFA